MISFITLSREPGKVRNLEESIGHACGSAVAWEIVVVDGTKHDLFTGYNAGALRAKGEALAFVHDDVQLLGNCLTVKAPLDLLRNPATGFVGVAGSRTVSAEGGWWEYAPHDSRGMASHPSEGEFGMHVNIWPWTDAARRPRRAAFFGQVAVLDGVFLMCSRATLDKIGGFDERSYKGFHFYDIDTTFRASMAGLKNYAAPIPLLHLSGGPRNEEWQRNQKVFVDKYRDLLPWSLP